MPAVDLDVNNQNVNEYKDRNEYGYNDNKSIPIKKIDYIEVTNFRTFKDRQLELGDNLTIISGKNATMKTTLMGLIAHPFSNENEDVFQKPLKTSLQEVFRLSTTYDDNYDYNICLTTNKNEKLKEKVTIDERGGRHRIVVSGHEKGDGNFNFNTSFLNLGRLSPIVETNAKEQQTLSLTPEEENKLVRFYGQILLANDNNKFMPVSDEKKKRTFGPTGDNAKYDFNSISSGEDNLGAIFNKLLSFERANTGGIFCIDEIEASLHPSAQINMVKYLLKWSEQNNVQVVLTTHSLHIIQYAYLNMQKKLEDKKIIINFISYSESTGDKNYPIISNPPYSLAYKELTLQNPEDVSKTYKANIYCEDEVAMHFVKTLLGRNICKLVSFEHNLDNDNVNLGTSKTGLISLCKNFPSIMYKTNSFVVLDADVESDEVEKIKDKTLFVILPDSEKLPLEKRVLIHLLNCPPNDDIFSKVGKIQDMIKNEIIQICRINPLNEDNIKRADTDTCKKWVKSNTSEFKKCVTHYCKSLPKETTNKFKKEFVDSLNETNSRLGLPKVDI